MPKFEKYEKTLVKKERNPEPSGKSFVSPDILSKAKRLVSDNKTVLTKDDIFSIERLAQDSTKDPEHLYQTKNRAQKSEHLRNKIKQIDESFKISSTNMSKVRGEDQNELKPHEISQIDEVKVVKSKKQEILNARDNLILAKEKNTKKRKENLIEVKADLQDELKLLDDLKQRQLDEKKAEEKRKHAYNILTQQKHENEMKRQREKEEKDAEQLKMKKHLESLVQDEINESDKQMVRKAELKHSLDYANQQMIDHKNYIKQLDKEEIHKIQEYLAEEDRKEAEFQAEEALKKKQKQEKQRQMLVQLEQKTDFQSKLDELRMKRYQDEQEMRDRKKELDRAQYQQQLREMLVEEGERQKEYKMQLMLSNIEEERKMQGKQMEEVVKEQGKAITNKDTIREQNLKNKEHLLAQIQDLKKIKKENKDSHIQEENKMIQMKVFETKKIVDTIKGEALKELLNSDVPLKNQKIINRIGKRDISVVLK